MMAYLQLPFGSGDTALVVAQVMPIARIHVLWLFRAVGAILRS
jgi:hypothetical protein